MQRIVTIDIGYYIFFTMFRRIEWISEMPISEWLATSGEDIAEFGFTRYFKYGITQAPVSEVIRAWSCDLNVPRREIKYRCRFYFTEAGWKRFGRPTIKACQKNAVKFRILAIEEHSVDVFYLDEWQIAVRPKRRKLRD